MPHLLSQASVPLGNLGGIGEIGNTSDAVNPFTNFALVISTVIGVFTLIGVLYFIFQLFIGAIGWISAGSDKQAMDTTKKRMTHAFLGLLIVVMSYTLIAVIGAILGIDIINLAALLGSIGIRN